MFFIGTGKKKKMDQEAVKALFNLHASPIVSKETLSLKMLPQLDLNSSLQNNNNNNPIGDQQNAAGTLYALMKANGNGASSFLTGGATPKTGGLGNSNTFAAVAKSMSSNNGGGAELFGNGDGRLRSRSFAASSSFFVNGEGDKSLLYNSKDHNGFVIQQQITDRHVRRPRSFSSHVAGGGKASLSSSANGNGQHHITSVKSVLGGPNGGHHHRGRAYSTSSTTSFAIDEDDANASSSSAPTLGLYSAETRQQRIQKFLDKRQRRIWRKRIKYDVRKNFADSRLRVKGRFVRKEDEDQLRSFLQML